MGATELAKRYGVAKVAVALTPDCTSRKRRLAATASSRAERVRSTPQPADFVERNFGLPLARAACVLILPDRHGHALRSELAQAAGKADGRCWIARLSGDRAGVLVVTPPPLSVPLAVRR